MLFAYFLHKATEGESNMTWFIELIAPWLIGGIVMFQTVVIAQNIYVKKVRKETHQTGSIFWKRMNTIFDYLGNLDSQAKKMKCKDE